MSITTDDIFKLTDLYFYEKNILFSHLHNSYNKFIDDIKNYLEDDFHCFNEKISMNKIYKRSFKYSNIKMENVKLNNNNIMFPTDAIQQNLTYEIILKASVEQYNEIIDIGTDDKVINASGNMENDVIIAKIPLMVGSKYCPIVNNKNQMKNECKYNPGGYFIINGSEKVIISQDKIVDNKPLFFIKKESGNNIYTIQINSKSHFKNNIQIININIRKDKIITIKLPILAEINIFIIFKAIGVESDKEIIDIILYDNFNENMIDILDNTLRECVDDYNKKIKTKEHAIDYLINKLRVIKKYNETDLNKKIEQKKIHLLYLLENSLIPHLSGNFKEKAYYIGYIINKLLNSYLNNLDPDDRDSYINKRIELPGDILFDIFKQYYKKNLNECNIHFKQLNTNDNNPVNIIHKISSGIIDTGIKSVLSKGMWANKTGIIQLLERNTQLQYQSILRRIDAMISGKSTVSKKTNIRSLHPSSVGFLCLSGDTIISCPDKNIKLKDIKNGDNVYSINTKTFKIEITKAINKFSYNVYKYYIIKAFDKIIKCTEDHKLFVLSDDKLLMKKACDITTNDYLACYNIFNKKHIDDMKYIIYNEFDKNRLKIFNKLNKKYIIKNNILKFKKKYLKYYNNNFYYEYYKNNKSINNYKYDKNNNIICFKIFSKRTIYENMMVYDFETENNFHTFIANDVISSNCTVSTPEHSKIGLTKHLGLITNITTFSITQYNLIKDELDKHMIYLKDADILQIRKMFKIFLNGDWLGITDKPHELEIILNKKKMNNYFDKKNVSIVVCYLSKEIRIYCDGGRLYRPVFNVENNEIKLKKKHIDDISLNKQSEKISSFNQFLIKYPDIIDYIDMEYQPYSLIAEDIHVLNNMKERKNKKIENYDDKFKENKYDDGFFLNYTHCEIHPSLLFGQIPANIPFANKNQGPRNIFQYSQGKQAMGLYVTNYRDRLDISFILHNTQKPLITTRTAKYTLTDNLPSGENVIVAIMCYTGYNQEDSIILNKTSVERGLFHSMSLKKYISIIQKNQSSSQDDIFMKPDPLSVIEMRPDAYSKLNNEGIVEPETVVNDGDIIIGKVTPLINNIEKYRDNSEKYKSISPGVVDRVYKDFQNYDGYQSRKVLIRINRIPRIGDKFCSRHGQKGVCGILLDNTDMPFNKDGIRPDIIINSNAFPSRMTLGQLMESITGKVAALEGHRIDGTSFEDFDIEYIEKKLIEHGFNKDGTEELYSGITGQKIKSKIFIGPTFYQRLKHIVEDKIHARARGNIVYLTRQPPEGRSKDGGLRLGEMERDAIISHGMSKFLNEKLLQNSDDYYIHVCNTCGFFTNRIKSDTNTKITPSEDDTYICIYCNSYISSKLRMPYAFKLLCQELASINIMPKINIK